MHKILILSLCLLTALALGACSLIPSVVKANPLTGPEQTQLAQTVAALEATATPTNTPVVSATPTQPPTQTPTQVPTATATPLPTQTPLPTSVPVPCDLAGFVGDVTVPDGTVMDPGAAFTKIWRLRNDGACTWTTAYQLVFTGGDLMSGPTVVQFPYDVAPGNTIDLSVGLVAPVDTGTYQGFWMLRDPNGAVFGLHPDGAHSFWVEIQVGASSDIFAVTHAAASADPTSYTGVCPVTITFSADITTSAAGTVTYHWQRSDGSNSPANTLTFDAAGDQTVSETWTLGAPGQVYNGWDQIYIDSPNHQSFEAAAFSIACNSPTPTQTPVPTLTSTPTHPAPTQTPEPTRTPTATLPAPTHTPAPTLTPTATLPAPTQTSTPAFTPTPTQPAPTKKP